MESAWVSLDSAKLRCGVNGTSPGKGSHCLHDLAQGFSHGANMHSLHALLLSTADIRGTTWTLGVAFLIAVCFTRPWPPNRAIRIRQPGTAAHLVHERHRTVNEELVCGVSVVQHLPCDLP